MNWREEANCLGMQTDQFFTLSEDSSTLYGGLPQVRKVCAACPVRRQCLQDALDTDEVWFGIRAGLTPTERRKLKAGAA